MGIVYKARHPRLDRLVALKMILSGAGAGPSDLARFDAEAHRRRHRSSQHRQDLRDRRARRPAVFLAGVSRRGQPVAADRRQAAAHRRPARIVETFARAMDVAHRRGIVHRDIKPANILLAADGTPKIADFGLVRRLEAELAPDWNRVDPRLSQLHGPRANHRQAEKAGPAADQYALGATLYEMLTGRPPFRGSSTIDTIDLVRNTEPVAPSQLLPRMPRDLETICLKALQKDPARRYPDVWAMAEDLRRFRRRLPILARPVSGPERVRRWCRRNPKVATLVAAVALLVVFGLIGATAAAVVITGKNRELNRFNLDLVAAKKTAENRRVEAENARRRRGREKASRCRRAGRDPAESRRRRRPARNDFAARKQVEECAGGSGPCAGRPRVGDAHPRVGGRGHDDPPVGDRLARGRRGAQLAERGPGGTSGSARSGFQRTSSPKRKRSSG